MLDAHALENIATLTLIRTAISAPMAVASASMMWKLGMFQIKSVNIVERIVA